MIGGGAASPGLATAPTVAKAVPSFRPPPMSAPGGPPPSSGLVPSSRSGKLVTPTMAGGEELHDAYHSLSPHVQGAIGNMDLVRGGHLSPEAAYNILMMSRGKGQNFGDVLAQHALGGKTPVGSGSLHGPQSIATAGPNSLLRGRPTAATV